MLPIPFMFMGIGGYTYLEKDFDNLNKVSAPEDRTFLEQAGSILGGFISMVGMYLKILVMGFNGIPTVINYFLTFLKVLSGFILLMMFRGN